MNTTPKTPLRALYQYAKSTDPEVVAAIRANDAGLQDFRDRAVAWAAGRGISPEDIRQVRMLGTYTLSGVRTKPDRLGDWKRNRRNGTWSPYAKNPERAAFDAIRFDRAQVPGLSSHYDASTRDGLVWMTPTPFIHDGAAWLALSEMPTSGDFGPQWVEVKGSEVMAALEARREVETA